MRLLLPLFLLLSIISFAQYDHNNISFLSLFNDSSVVAESNYGVKYQSCWGWFNVQSGKEYGILGSTAGTYIIEVTDPANPVLRDYIPHRQNDCIWHEYKTYGDYLYIISDDDGNNSLQIADLSYLPDSAFVVYDSTDIFIHSHTLFIDGNKMYVGSVTKTPLNFSSMNVYSLSDPVHPTLLRRLDADFPFIASVHDMFVVNDTVYASCGYDGLYIFRYDSIGNRFLLLGSLQDAVNIYNHSSFLSSDHQTLYMCEEIPDGQPVKIVDVSDINNPTLIDAFYSHPGATPHNPSVRKDRLIMAYYQDGVYVYNIEDPLVPVLEGYFDTYPDNLPGNYTVPAYKGCWSTYNDLPSGTLLASDMQSGLFCLDISRVIGINDIENSSVNFYPNPVLNNLHINGQKNNEVYFYDITGKLCFSESITSDSFSINISNLSEGIYYLKIKGKNSTTVNKVIKL